MSGSRLPTNTMYIDKKLFRLVFQGTKLQCQKKAKEYRDATPTLKARVVPVVTPGSHHYAVYIRSTHGSPSTR